MELSRGRADTGLTLVMGVGMGGTFEEVKKPNNTTEVVSNQQQLQEMRRREGVLAPGLRPTGKLVADELPQNSNNNDDQQLSLPMKNNLILAESLAVLQVFKQAVESEFRGMRGQASQKPS
ncbi:hypothetical protein CEUSTIGMA_g1394.t1 [Chlamydomonas eustigma]|uniref:Uncharacterized protein n=1 Tax=Chlamydomonas eustigma TaxID=1157962 RepID=A0A250WSY2_9CHLO|nr:hypothetical protein CEUSTIGMA_g1394.t1 [Chlamydomonas eustigma]|eukprot:GAX73944.1 hypothetical protein CEUSTIGMA_g1394.t1 [Chlamydomonas eustigma]